MMSDICPNIYQLCILLRNFRSNLSAMIFEPKNMMKSLSEDIIILKLSEYNYCRETGIKPKLILFWFCDTVAFLK